MEIYPLIDPRLKKGTVAGQILYWDGSRWVPSDESYLKWVAATKKATIENVITKRLLAGGVLT